MTEPSDRLSVETASQADLDALVQVAQAHRAFHQAFTALEEVSEGALRDRVAAALFGPSAVSEALLARCGARPAGALYYGFLFPTIDYGIRLFVKDLFVCDWARRRGVGAALVRRCVDVARDRGADWVELHVAPENHAAQRFYAAQGFSTPPRMVFRVAPGQGMGGPA